MSRAIPADAISARRHKPTPHQEVIAWISDKSVAIEGFPVIAWWTYEGSWWSGVPGNYIDLRRLKWTVTHWKPLAANSQEQ